MPPNRDFLFSSRLYFEPAFGIEELMNTNKGPAGAPAKYRILAITNTYSTADTPGDSPQIQDQVMALQARGLDVDVMYVNRYKGKQAYAEAAWKIFLLSFRPKRYDLIHAYYGHCGLLARLQVRLEYANLALEFLPEAFTLPELQGVYEAILNRQLDKRNFRKKLLAQGVLTPSGERRSGVGRPAQLYRRAKHARTAAL